VNARLWHNHCTRETPVEPAAVTVSQWKTMTALERGAHTDQLELWLEHLYAQTDELDDICDLMTDVVRSNSQGPGGAKTVLAITGPNLAGKSTMMMRWARDRYNEWTRDAEHDQRGRPVIRPTAGREDDLCPVVWTNIDAAARVIDLDSKIVKFFGLSGDGVKRDISDRSMAAAERHHARVLIIDDAHFINTNWADGRAVLDHIKAINTNLGDIGATLILVGADLEGRDLITDPQIAGRLKLRTFPDYLIGTDDQMRTWQGILQTLEDAISPHLPKGKPEILVTDHAGELWLRTQGYLGDLIKLLCGATLSAREDGTFRILQRHLDAVELSKDAESSYHLRPGKPRYDALPRQVEPGQRRTRRQKSKQTSRG
jgi:hypothetical protein